MSTARQGQQDIPIPNLAGKVMTVNGPIDPNQLGITLMHEHLFVDIRKTYPPNENTTATEIDLWDQKLTLQNLHLARDLKPIGDNWILADEQMAIKEVSEFQKAGGGTLVDVTSKGLKRDPLALQRVSWATGLNVVMGSGWYHSSYHPEDMDQRTIEQLTDEIIRDVTLGVGETGIRSGIIGEIGVEFSPIPANEIKCVRAAARASRATGAALTLHRAGVGREKLQIVQIVEEEGGDLTRTILGHSDNIAGEMPLMTELLDRGVYIEFDLMGRVEVPLTFLPTTTERGGYGHGYALTALVAEGVVKLLEAGYGDRILLSQDVCGKMYLKSYGGTGYSFMFEKFLPHLRKVGVTEEQIHKLMVENPKRALTFTEPK